MLTPTDPQGNGRPFQHAMRMQGGEPKPGKPSPGNRRIAGRQCQHAPFRQMFPKVGCPYFPACGPTIWAVPRVGIPSSDRRARKNTALSRSRARSASSSGKRSNSFRTAAAWAGGMAVECMTAEEGFPKRREPLEKQRNEPNSPNDLPNVPRTMSAVPGTPAHNRPPGRRAHSMGLIHHPGKNRTCCVQPYGTHQVPYRPY